MKLEFFFLRFYVIHEEYPLVCLITFLLYLRIQDKPAAVNPIDYHPSIKMFDDSIEHRCLDLIRIEDYIRAYLKILGVIFRMANVYFKEKKKKTSHITPFRRIYTVFSQSFSFEQTKCICVYDSSSSIYEGRIYYVCVKYNRQLC